MAGRPVGSKNNKANELKNMILASFTDSRVGGIEYLVRQSTENPTAYIGLIGKVLPKEVEMQVSRSIFEQADDEPTGDTTEV